jgi:hypothetical protein
MIIPLCANTFKQDTLQNWQWRRLCTTTHVLRDKTSVFSRQIIIRVSTIHENKICKQQLNLMWHQKLQEPWTQKNCNSLFLIHLTWFFTGAFIWVHTFMRGTCPDATPFLSSSVSWRTLGANTETSQTDLSSEVLAHMDRDPKPAQTLTPSHILAYANTCRLKMRETKPNNLSSLSRICDSLSASKCRRPIHMFQQCC